MKIYFARSYLLPLAVKIGTPRFQRFVVDILPWKNLHEFRDIIDVFHETSVEIIETKRRALAEGDEVVARQIGQGKDVISILCTCSFFSIVMFGVSDWLPSLLVRENGKLTADDRMSESELLGQVGYVVQINLKDPFLS